MQIVGCVELLLALLLFVLILFIWRNSIGGHGFATVLSMMVLQVPLNRAHGELPSDTYISSWKILCREIGEIFEV